MVFGLGASGGVGPTTTWTSDMSMDGPWHWGAREGAKEGEGFGCPSLPSSVSQSYHTAQPTPALAATFKCATSISPSPPQAPSNFLLLLLLSSSSSLLLPSSLELSFLSQNPSSIREVNCHLSSHRIYVLILPSSSLPPSPPGLDFRSQNGSVRYSRFPPYGCEP